MPITHDMRLYLFDMKPALLIKSAAISSIPLSSRLKIFLLALAFTIIAGTLLYTHNLVQALSKKEKEVVAIACFWACNIF